MVFRGIERRHDAAQRFDAERQRRDVEQDHILDISRQHAALNRGADRHDFIGIHPLVRLLAEVLLHELLHLRHARRSADEDDLVDRLRIEARIGDRLPHRLHRPLQKVVDELLEFRARQFHRQVLRPRLVCRDERQIDVGFERRRKLDFRFLRGFLQALHRDAILGEIDAVGLLELRRDPLDDPLIDVVAAEMGVAVGRLDLDDALTDFEDRDVERAATEVVHRDGLVLLLVEPVGERGRRRLVDDAEDVEACDLAGVFRRLALCVVEVRGHRDDRVGDRLAEIVLGRLLQLLEHHRGDLRRRELLAAGLDPRVAVVGGDDAIGNALLLTGHLGKLPAHETLDGEHGVFRVGDGLPLRDLPDESLTFFSECDDRRGDSRAFLVDQYSGLPTFHNCDHGVCRSEVDSNNFALVGVCHVRSLRKYISLCQACYMQLYILIS